MTCTVCELSEKKIYYRYWPSRQLAYYFVNCINAQWEYIYYKHIIPGKTMGMMAYMIVRKQDVPRAAKPRRLMLTATNKVGSRTNATSLQYTHQRVILLQRILMAVPHLVSYAVNQEFIQESQ